MASTFVHSLFGDQPILGIDITNLPYGMIYKLVCFKDTAAVWLEENIGKLNEKWYIKQDDEAKSFRVVFYNIEDETYFILAWIHGEMQDYENSH